MIEDSVKVFKQCLGWEEVQVLSYDAVRLLVALGWVAAGFLDELGVTLAWAEVASIDVADRWAAITATDGRTRRIDLTDVFQPQAVRDALASARSLLDEARHAARASIESGAAST